MKHVGRLFGAASLLAVLLLPLSQAPTAQAANEFSIQFCAGPWAAVDSNMPGVEGPQVVTYCVAVTNTTGSACDNIDVYIGDGTTPGTFPLGSDATTSLTLLGGVGEAHRFIPTLGAGASQSFMWELEYPPTYGVTYGATVWAVSQDLSCTGSGTHDITTRSSISAAANKIGTNIVVDPPSGTVAVGNIVTVTITDFDFGLIGAGPNNEEDGWEQPIGNLTFDPSCFRLIATEVDIATIDPPFTMPIFNHLYFPGIGSINPLPNYSNTSTDYVKYTFIALQTCTTTMFPYQEAASGQEEKYSGDYGRTTISQTLTSSGSSIAMDKSVDPLSGTIGDTLTWTIEYHNTTSIPVGDPNSGAGLVIIEQAVPSETEYLSGTAGCSGYSCLIYYSTDGGANWSLTEPVPASDVNAIKWYITEQIPAFGSGTVFFDTEITQTDGSICNTATAQIGESEEVVAQSTACANAGAATLTAEKTVALFSEVDCGGQISPGDTVEYTVVITNTSAVPAQNVLYTDTPDANTTLVVGSVTTSHGFIDIGNTGGDTTVQVDVGTIAPAEVVTITYQVVLTDGDYASISNQGHVDGDNIGEGGIDTDDPGTVGALDATVAEVFPAEPCPPPPTSRSVGGEAMLPDRASIVGSLLLAVGVLAGAAMGLRRLFATR